MLLRDYQSNAVSAAMGSKNGILVLPTGSGKSHVIAGIADRIDGKVIVLQPTKEILESNLDKIKLTGIKNVGVFSASMGIKRLGKVTYATIGSIIKIAKRLTDVEVLIIDECHLVNAKGGQYLEFIKTLQPKKLIGLTATPYRLHTNSYGSQMKMLNRTRPKIFKDIIHITQSRDLIESGHLLDPNFFVTGDDPGILKPNTTGADYSEGSIQRYFDETRLADRIVVSAENAIRHGYKHLLIFVSSIMQSKKVFRKLEDRYIPAGTVSGKTNKANRELRLKMFRKGNIRGMVNVGVLTTGYDFPRLDCIISARPTMSLALYYQIIGRCVRPHPEKPRPIVFDLVDNFGKFGNPLEFKLVKGQSGLYSILSKHGRLTGTSIEDGPEVDHPMDFGKHRGVKLSEVPTDYMEWYLENANKSPVWHQFDAELMRRELWK